MTVKIYHNPRCSKSRQTLEILRSKGIDPEIIDYLHAPPTLCALKALMDALELDSALPMVRTKEPEFKESGLTKESDNADLLAAITQYPKLLERPIVVTEKGARICRPPEVVEVIL